MFDVALAVALVFVLCDYNIIALLYCLVCLLVLVAWVGRLVAPKPRVDEG